MKKNLSKWYQTSLPLDEDINQYFIKLQEKHKKKLNKHLTKNKPKTKNNGATQINNEWREYLAK